MNEWKGLSLSFGTSDIKRLTKVFPCHEMKGLEGLWWENQVEFHSKHHTQRARAESAEVMSMEGTQEKDF